MKLDACQWLMLGQIQMGVNSSLQQLRHHGYLVIYICKLDGKHVVFGKVLENYELIKKMESYGSSSGNPSKKVVFATCRVVTDEDL